MNATRASKPRAPGQRKVRPGAYALDCHGSILHFAPGVTAWPAVSAVARDVELQMLGMVEVRVVEPSGRTWYTPLNHYDPYYLYRSWAMDRTTF